VVRWPNPPTPLPGYERSGYFLRAWGTRDYAWEVLRTRATVFADVGEAGRAMQARGLDPSVLVCESAGRR
jgi:hypothetical protein